MLCSITVLYIKRTTATVVLAVLAIGFCRSVEAQTFTPKPLLSTKERLTQAKQWLEVKTADRRVQVLKALDSYAINQRLKKSFDKKLAEDRHGKTKAKLHPAEIVRDRFERDGVLPKTAVGFPEFKEIQAMAESGLHVPNTRVRLAYSDLIRESRQSGRLLETNQLEAEASEFLKAQTYQLAGKVETIEELYGYDFGLALQTFRWDMPDSNFQFERICEGLSLPSDAPSAPHWPRLVTALKRLQELRQKAAPIEKARKEQRAAAFANALVGGLAAAGSDSFLGTEVDAKGNVAGSYKTELSELVSEINASAFDRVRASGRAVLSAEEALEQIQVQANITLAPLYSCQDDYFRRRAAQLKLKEDNSILEVTRSSSHITIKSTTATGDVYISFTASALPENKIPKSHSSRINAARKNLDNPKLFLMHPDISRKLREANEDWKTLRRPVRDSQTFQLVPGRKVQFKEGTKFGKDVTRYTNDISEEQIEFREVQIFAVGENFQATYKLPPTR